MQSWEMSESSELRERTQRAPCAKEKKMIYLFVFGIYSCKDGMCEMQEDRQK